MITLAIRNFMTKEENKRILLAGAIIGALVFYLMVSSFAFAVETPDYVTTLLESIIDMVSLVMRIMGVFFLIIGIPKWFIAHNNDQGPEQRNAVMWIASGAILLIAAPMLISMVPWADLISGN